MMVANVHDHVRVVDGMCCGSDVIESMAERDVDITVNVGVVAT